MYVKYGQEETVYFAPSSTDSIDVYRSLLSYGVVKHMLHSVDRYKYKIANT